MSTYRSHSSEETIGIVTKLQETTSLDACHCLAQIIIHSKIQDTGWIMCISIPTLHEKLTGRRKTERSETASRLSLDRSSAGLSSQRSHSARLIYLGNYINERIGYMVIRVL